MTDLTERMQKGRAMAAKLFAGATSRASSMPPRFQEYTFGHLFGEVWQDETLSLAERELVTCTTLVALNRINEQHLHFVGARNAGVPREKMEAMIAHVAHYAGWPCAASAFGVLNEVWPPQTAPAATDGR